MVPGLPFHLSPPTLHACTAVSAMATCYGHMNVHTKFTLRSYTRAAQHPVPRVFGTNFGGEWYTGRGGEAGRAEHSLSCASTSARLPANPQSCSHSHEVTRARSSTWSRFGSCGGASASRSGSQLCSGVGGSGSGAAGNRAAAGAATAAAHQEVVGGRVRQALA